MQNASFRYEEYITKQLDMKGLFRSGTEEYIP
jgi:hypothetical protein